jgi:hypothetical protein
MNSYTGPLPRHRYIYIDSAFTHREPIGFIPAVWFALASWPGRAWGCTVVLESGACYRNLPPHALAFRPDPEPEWEIQDAQRWDCYGWQWVANCYPYLDSQRVIYRSDGGGCDGAHARGDYLFSVAPANDGFSAEPGQNKEFTFIALDNGRLTIQPTDYVLFADLSFCKPEWPRGLKRQTEIHSAEDDFDF